MKRHLPALITGLMGWGALLLFVLHTRLYAVTYHAIRAGQRELIPWLYDLERLCYLDLALLIGCLAFLWWLWWRARGEQL